MPPIQKEPSVDSHLEPTPPPSVQLDPPSHIINSLAVAHSASEAIKNLYTVNKKINPKFSLTYICRQAKMSSAGYLSDVMRGKRKLNSRYHQGIIKAFNLKGPAASYLKTLFKLDQEKDVEQQEQLRKKLSIKRKRLYITHNTVNTDTSVFFLALEVFCAFGLFNNSPTHNDLYEYFSSHSPKAIKDAIEALISMGLVKFNTPNLELSSTQVNFGGQRINQLEYLKMAFTHGVLNMQQWYDKPNSAVFESFNMSVRRDTLEQTLPRFREWLDETRVELESDQADLLVRLNVQLYPIK